jgi:hypothetical protein
MRRCVCMRAHVWTSPCAPTLDWSRRSPLPQQQADQYQGWGEGERLSHYYTDSAPRVHPVSLSAPPPFAHDARMMSGANILEGQVGRPSAQSAQYTQPGATCNPGTDQPAAGEPHHVTARQFEPYVRLLALLRTRSLQLADTQTAVHELEALTYLPHRTLSSQDRTKGLLRRFHSRSWRRDSLRTNQTAGTVRARC